MLSISISTTDVEKWDNIRVLVL